MSETFKNIKIPYPQEGVIRSAQLNDTVCPEDSVQLAVNMNFDRVGAMQTRLGVETYATQLTGAVKNFGTLNNSTETNENRHATQIGTTGAFNSQITNNDISSVGIDDNRAIVFWQGTTAEGYTQVIYIDTETGVFSPLGAALNFDNTGVLNEAIKVDANHFMNVWKDAASAGVAQIFEVNLTTNAITAMGTPFSFDANGYFNGSLSKVDANHFILFYGGGIGALGRALVFEVNLSTWAVTKPGSAIVFDGVSNYFNSSQPLGNGTHFVNFWRGSNGFAQAFSVNLGTWAITAIGTPLTFATTAQYNSAQSLGDGKHFINFWADGTGAWGATQVFNVNPSTFAITTAGTKYNFTKTTPAAYALYISSASFGDGIHFMAFWRDFNGYGYGNNFKVNLSTFNISITDPNLKLSDTYFIVQNNAILLSDHNIVNFSKFFNNSSTEGGVAALFRGFGGITTFTDYLYAQQGNYDVKNWNGSAWATVRSGLSTAQKARFAQFLNYVWMVNGNEQFGDPTMISDGGAFTATGVPLGFPQGDFISAGFDGRVWVADKTSDTLYFTDIVQFVPPSLYTITYTPTNFMKSFSPQDGESITGLFRVPKALLLFKENHIFRIYGGFAADPYPAYNVGTYSQESIVQAKDGIYFHHSSGFYKFAYDSQPIEISRRVIDFVKAIPRANYENVVGIYDGFDSVKWSVGSVTVEGVTFTNCQMRYSISTQVWTVYDFTGNDITALIRYDNGTTVDQIVGTSVGKVGKLDSGLTDFGAPIYFEMIDRWRSFTEMYSKAKSLSGLMILSENGGGTLVQYQSEKTPVNVWEDIDTVSEDYASLFPNASTKDFTTMRLRYRGYTSGTPIVFHGTEVLSIQDKGFEKN